MSGTEHVTNTPSQTSNRRDNDGNGERGERGDKIHKKTRGHRNKMDRVTFRVSKDKLEEIDELVEDNEYPNTSEALRSAVDRLLLTEGRE